MARVAWAQAAPGPDTVAHIPRNAASVDNELLFFTGSSPLLALLLFDRAVAQSSYEMIDCLSRLTTKRVTSGRE